MRIIKALVIIIPIVTAILAWTMPFGIAYGLLIGSLSAITLVLSHMTKENIVIRILISICMIFFYGIALVAYTLNYIT